MRVGISASTVKDFSVWSNGITQNLVFLALLLRKIPWITKVLLLDAGAERTLGPQIHLDQLGLSLIPLAESGDHVDVIIELSGALPVTWADLQRARGKIIIGFNVAQPYSHLLDITLFDRPGHVQRPDHYDQIWLLPKDEAYLPLARTLYRCPATIAPFIWSPMFLDQRLEEVRAAGLQFGFKANAPKRGEGWRIAVFEPNLAPIKTSLVPMLVADVAERQRPGAIDHLVVLNAEHMVKHGTLLYFGNALDLVRKHRATFVGRHDVAGFMAQHRIQAVVAHQWGNAQNYLYLDVLYGGYPLVHNSPWIERQGYFYPHNEAAEGARQLLHAMDRHAAEQGQRQRDAAALFRQVAIDAAHNIEAYASLLAPFRAVRPA